MPNFLLSMAVCERHGRIEVYIFYDKWAVGFIGGGWGGGWEGVGFEGVREGRGEEVKYLMRAGS